MRIACTSDLHLGFRQFSATEGGRNAREQDVEQAWLEVVRQIIAERPHLVTIAGDIFHHLRVSDYARMAFLRGLQQILDGTRATIIVLQGNHEAARTVESLTPIALATVFKGRVHVVAEPKRIRISVADTKEPLAETVSVACLPFTTRTEGAAYLLEPDPEADVNVLIAHAAVRGDAEGDALPRFYGSDQDLDVGRAASAWDAIAVGDFHEFRRLHPTAAAFYSGSIERTSSNIWDEKASKGFVVVDTEARTMEFRPVPTRKMYDFGFRDFHAVEPVCAQGVNAALSDLTTRKDIVGAIVRLKVDDFPREEREKIDRDLVSQLLTRCLHFQLDLKYAAAEGTDMGDRRDRSAMSLAELAAGFFAEDPEEVRALAYRFLGVEAGVEDAEWAEA